MKRKSSSDPTDLRQKRYKPNRKKTLEEEIVYPWLALFKHYKQTPCGLSEDYRRFKAWLGVSPDVAEMIYCKYFHESLLPDRDRLALVLNFLKNMPVQDERASNFRLSRPTYRKYLWETLTYLHQTMKEVFFFVLFIFFFFFSFFYFFFFFFYFFF
jgi:hypothetical protein